MRTFVVGDIHGANKALEQVLERSGFDKNLDLLITLGDIVDGWGESPECVETLLSIKNRVDIVGNHDNWVYDWLERGIINNMWLSQGGHASRDAYVRTGDIVNEDHKKFFRDQVNYYLDKESRLFIHGGWDWRFNSDFFKAGLYGVHDGSTRARDCHWDRTLYDGFREHHEDHLPKGLREAVKPFKEVYIGHTAVKHPYLPFNKGKLWNMDTGAGWDGKLTLMDIDTKEYWQSDLCTVLYSEERGRM